MFEQKTGVWCDFNENEQDSFRRILDLADRHVGEVPGGMDRETTITMVNELRRVFNAPRGPEILEGLLIQRARRANNHYVGPRIVRCVYDSCSASVERTAQTIAWVQARNEGWKLMQPKEGTIVDLVCPEHAAELGRTQ